MLHLLDNMPITATKVWKEKPPGREQIELERMFKCKEIDSRATPDSVKRRNDLFKDFSAAVFSKHFRKTKAKLGLSANVSNAGEGPSSILELGGFSSKERSRSPQEMLQDSTDFIQMDTITQNNAPCWTWVYTDHEKKKDFVCVVVPSVCGKKAKFTISEDGMQIEIKYDWPEVMFKAGELFSKSIGSTGRKLPMSHPKIHSFVSHLHDSGVTEKSSLQSNITINLPKKIQRENDSWTMEKVVVSDVKMIILEFSAYQKSLIINDADTSLDF